MKDIKKLSNVPPKRKVLKDYKIVICNLNINGKLHKFYGIQKK